MELYKVVVNFLSLQGISPWSESSEIALTSYVRRHCTSTSGVPLSLGTFALVSGSS